PGTETLRVLGTLSPTTADDHTDDNRHRSALAIKHVIPFGGLIDDLFHAQQRKIKTLMRQDRPHAAQRGADDHARERIFRQRRVHHPVTAKFLYQAAGGSKNSLGIRHAQSDEESAWITLQANLRCLADGLGEGYFPCLGFFI